MNKIEKLIKEFCPDGVEWKKLGEVCEILDNKRIKEKLKGLTPASYRSQSLLAS